MKISIFVAVVLASTLGVLSSEGSYIDDFFCANALDPLDRVGYPPDSEFEEIPGSYFSTCFNNVFTIKVHWDDWDDPNEAFWSLANIQDFAEKILPAECTPDSAWAHRIAQYIGEDVDETFLAFDSCGGRAMAMSSTGTISLCGCWKDLGGTKNRKNGRVTLAVEPYKATEESI